MQNSDKTFLFTWVSSKGGKEEKDGGSGVIVLVLLWLKPMFFVIL